jgi:polysaccharide chain length determinant protein (PEP-CTERM system associated)
LVFHTLRRSGQLLAQGAVSKGSEQSRPTGCDAERPQGHIPMIPGKKYTPEDFLVIAWRRKWLLLPPLVLGAVAALVWAHFQPDLYRSETVILVVPQRVPENYVRSTVTTRLQDRLQSINQQILSRTRLERIIQDFDLYTEMRRTGFMEAVVDEMRRNINPQIVKGDAFKISYVSTDPRLAMQVTERLASLYIDESLKDREVLAEGTNQFLETQLQDARQRLIEHEKKLEGYNRRHSGELPTQVTSNLQALNGAQMQLQAIADSMNRDRDRRINLERLLGDLSAQTTAAAEASVLASSFTNTPSPRAPSNPQLDDARTQLRDLELRLKPAHPDIARARKLVEDLEQKAEAAAAAMELAGTPIDSAKAPSNPNDPVRRTSAVREEMDTLDQQIAVKEKEEQRLKKVIAEYQRRVEATPTRESELIELTRDYSTIQQMYRNLLTKNEDAKISANLERRQIGEQFKVIDPARLPQQPFSPDRVRITLLGALAGLALGVGLGALLEYRDTTLKTDEDVLAALSLPVLALVPVIRSAAERRQLGRRRVLLSVTSAATMGVFAVVLFILYKSNWRP